MILPKFLFLILPISQAYKYYFIVWRWLIKLSTFSCVNNFYFVFFFCEVLKQVVRLFPTGLPAFFLLIFQSSLYIQCISSLLVKPVGNFIFYSGLPFHSLYYVFRCSYSLCPSDNNCHWETSPKFNSPLALTTLFPSLHLQPCW